MKEKETPVVDEKVEGLKVKKKPGRPRKLTKKDETLKVDLSKKEEDKKEENAVQEQTTNEVPVRDESPVSEEVSKENVKETTARFQKWHRNEINAMRQPNHLVMS